MQTLLVDPAWLEGSFGYRKYTGRGNGGGSTLENEVPVTNCRIDYKPSYSRTATDTIKIGDATIYCYAAYTDGVEIDDLIEKSEVIINGKTYTVKQVKIYTNIADGSTFSRELVIL